MLQRLPKCEETNDSDGHKQLKHENGVHLRVDKHSVRAMEMLLWCAPLCTGGICSISSVVGTFLMKVRLMFLSSQANWASISA